MATLPISLQLYTVRDLQAKDFVGTVTQVKQIGYEGVELAGYGNLGSAAAVKKALDDVGLKISGAHAGLDRLENELPKVLDEQKLFSNKFLICPFVPEPRRTLDGYKKIAQTLNKAGTEARERGITFCYHHHSFEFQKFDGQTAMDLLLTSTDPELVKVEVDVYWAKHGGQDPVAFMNKLGKRCPLLHLKDMAAGADRRFAEVGTGILDFPAILAAADKLGVAWGAVEQDECYGVNPIDAVRTSFNNLKKMRAK